ncbi:efflux RND transporter periplasmic adaptor subunit [Candidatus Zixiibacteriota bacterium]
MKKNAFLIMLAVMLTTATFAACGNGSVSENTSAEEAVSPASVAATPVQQAERLPTQRPSPPPGPGAWSFDADEGRRQMTILTAKSRVVVLNRVSGMVTSLNVEEGDRVSVGEVLASLDRETHRLRAARAAAEAGRTRAIYLRNLEAFREEARIRIVSELELEVSRTEYLQAQADSALMAVELGYTEIKAPISGHVIERNIQQGQWIGLQEECFTVADLSTLWAVFMVSRREVAELSVNSPVSLTVDPDGDDPFHITGRVELISPVVDPGGGVKITVSVPQLAGQPRLRAGLSVTLESGQN